MKVSFKFAVCINFKAFLIPIPYCLDSQCSELAMCVMFSTFLVLVSGDGMVRHGNTVKRIKCDVKMTIFVVLKRHYVFKLTFGYPDVYPSFTCVSVMIKISIDL